VAAFFCSDGTNPVQDEITRTRLICSGVKKRRKLFRLFRIPILHLAAIKNSKQIGVVRVANRPVSSHVWVAVISSEV